MSTGDPRDYCKCEMIHECGYVPVDKPSATEERDFWRTQCEALEKALTIVHFDDGEGTYTTWHVACLGCRGLEKTLAAHKKAKEDMKL